MKPNSIGWTNDVLIAICCSRDRSRFPKRCHSRQIWLLAVLNTVPVRFVVPSNNNTSFPLKGSKFVASLNDFQDLQNGCV